MDEFAGVWRLDGRPIAPSETAALQATLAGGRSQVLAFEPYFTAVAAYRLTSGASWVGHGVRDTSELGVLASAHLTERAALIQQLGLSAAQPDPGDLGLIRLAVERWGAAGAVERLRGDFALASWDGRNRRLFLARDASGHRTLYVHRSSGLVAFATRLTTLLALPGVPKDLDERAVAEFLITCHDRPTRTLYRAIDRVEAGRLALISPDGTRVQSFAPGRPVPGALSLPCDADYLAGAREVLDAAVADAYRGAGPVTLALTGGLDSAAVACSALRQELAAPVAAATRIASGPFPDPTPAAYYDEALRVRTFAAMHPGLDWRATVDEAEDGGEHDDITRFTRMGFPALMPMDFPWLFPVYRFAGQPGSAAALIDGRHGNCYFSYPGSEALRHMLAPRDWPKLLRECGARARRTGRPAWVHLAGVVVRTIEPDTLQRWRKGGATRLWRDRFAINRNFAAELRLDETIDPKRYAGQHGIGMPTTQEVRVWRDSSEISHDLFSALRSWTGLDFRHPLGDRRVTEFFGALPYDQLLRNATDRSMARRLLRGDVPDEFIDSGRRGRQSGDWFARLTGRRSALYRKLEYIQASPLARRLLDLDKLRDWLDDWPADIQSAEVHRFRLLRGLAGGIEMGSFLSWHEAGRTP